MTFRRFLLSSPGDFGPFLLVLVLATKCSEYEYEYEQEQKAFGLIDGLLGAIGLPKPYNGDRLLQAGRVKP